MELTLLPSIILKMDKHYRILHCVIAKDKHIILSTIECKTPERLYLAETAIAQTMSDLRVHDLLPKDSLDNYIVVERWDGNEWLEFYSDEDESWSEYCLNHFE